MMSYIDRQSVTDEVTFARKLSAKHDWPLLDVTRRSIEETAAAIMKLYSDRQRQRLRNDVFAMTLWRGKAPLMLASQSRARQMLLTNAGHFVRGGAGRYRRARDSGNVRAFRTRRNRRAAGAREGGFVSSTNIPDAM